MDTLKPTHGKGLTCNLSLQDHNTPNKGLVAMEPLYHKWKQIMCLLAITLTS